MIVALHLRQRILASRSCTFSSAMEYLAPQVGQESFTATLGLSPPEWDGTKRFNELHSDYILSEVPVYHARTIMLVPERGAAARTT